MKDIVLKLALDKYAILVVYVPVDLWYNMTRYLDTNLSKRRMSMKIKGLQLTDILIIVLMSAVIGLDMDFAKLDTIDYVCLGAFAFWLLALVARLYIANRKD